MVSGDFDDWTGRIEALLIANYAGKVVEDGKEILFRCPCHEDRHPSASYNRERCAWTCFGCGASGGLRRGDRPLAELLGLEAPPRIDWSARRLHVDTEREAAEGRKREALASYWRERRLADALVRERDLLSKLAGEGIGPEAVEHFQLGYTTYSGTPALVIPWLIGQELEKPTVRAVQYRLLGDRIPGGRYRWHPGSNPTLFNADAILQPASGRLCVVEGAKKAMALWQAGLRSTVGLANKTAKWMPAYSRAAAAFDEVVFLPDPDAQAEAREWAQQVTGRARVACLPAKPDDLLLEVGGDVRVLEAYIAQARLVD